ncbi:hypothetical protein FM110_05135 [Brachybacterium nesterenkovii]|uniref:Uncharacterized protein n=1 Tax=Brachybacterium nesterenkovii TaxID=47847 RepID=A0A1X6WXT5_9MICO|nr:hypothetical protein FM110_05135 [Brachybacterium nesterenkovii]
MLAVDPVLAVAPELAVDPAFAEHRPSARPEPHSTGGA